MSSSEVLQALPIPVLVVGQDQRVTGQNGAAAHLFGADLLGRHVATAIRQPALLEAIEAVLVGAPHADARLVFSPHGRDLIYNVHVATLSSERSAILTFLDVSRQEEAGQMRSDFVANVSHELRTPLTALTGFIETLRGPARDDPAARARFLDIMEKEAGRMNRLVTDLLSLGRLEDMGWMRPTDLVELDQVILMVINALNPAAKDRNVDVRASFDTTRPVIVLGDRDQLTQVFTNLTENAIKYGHKGGTVQITVKAVAQMPAFKGPGLEVTVQDDGDGIDSKHLGRLTERFYRVDNHRSRELGGTGLGLAIVKHIVNRHRGRLRIESTPGAGSCFSVTLPVPDPT
ncbi:two-component system, OmpR family, phosphate regulon sensor histidine kinase PhoR [Aliiroseovarius sediminilitoris]|uniref:histidine kinase n=1 Tax=Aliiroseovarius sediminilitoris TaxID=1173584 RepID=A0A1I0PSF1_9RHOB|nr:ATP-binding protein [Aliiroseovarius sediminilitoris]SEW17297.1 two-component system, OmpR family, phosphate regulon sensor histidine kinase PhoR [Aliiroseovarius sediminilitoris]